MAIYPLPKSYHSDFNSPFKKPVGRVEIDPNHPLAGYVNSLIINGTSLGLDRFIGVYKTLGGGQGYGVSTTNGAGWDFPNVAPASVFPAYSVFMHFAQTVFPALDRVYYSERPSGTQIFKIVTNGSAGLSWVIRNAGGTGLQVSPVSADPDQTKLLHSFMFVKASDTDRKIYVDDNVGSHTVSSGGTYNTSVPSICYDPEDQSAGQNNINALVTYTFSKALTAEEFASLKRNPYQLLRPVSTATYFTPTAAGTDVIFSGTIPTQTGTQDSVFVWDAGTSNFTNATAFNLATGTLQAGITLNTVTGELEGTPTGFGTDSGLSIQGTGTALPATSNLFDLVISPLDVVFSGTIPNQTGTINSVFVFNIGTGAWADATSFALATGTLQAGLSVNASTGDIEGTPTESGTNVGISIQGSGDGNPDTSNTFDITINPEDGPDPFSFDLVFGAELSTLTESSIETITGFGTGFTISSAGAEYRIDSGTYVTTAGTIDPGQTVQMRQTSSPSFATLTTVTLTIDTEVANFNVITKADPSVSPSGELRLALAIGIGL